MSYLKKRFPILLFKSWKAMGLFKGSFLIIQYFLFKTKRYQFKAFKYPLYLRPGSTDLDVLLQFLSDRHYEIEYPGNINYILDGGANIGLASIFFIHKFPAATILAVEPDPDNYKILLKNIQPYPNIRPINGGLWSKMTWLRVEKHLMGEWAFTVSASDIPTGIKAYSIAEILDITDIPSFDLVKLDIEGSEKEVFESSNLDWLDKVSVLIVEFHDHMRPGGASKVFSEIVSRPFQMTLKDENLIFEFEAEK